jgi:hypothetical protein
VGCYAGGLSELCYKYMNYVHKRFKCLHGWLAHLSGRNSTIQAESELKEVKSVFQNFLYDCYIGDSFVHRAK